MQLNADFAQRAVVHAAREPWVPSPMPGVERRMLDRIGGEVARATSIVRYAPGSCFSPHTHHGGEEFLVLEGVFRDEHGDYPAGWYIRNPPTSRHTPGSERGCIILVKLWQFDPDDRHELRIDANAQSLRPDPALDGVRAALLHRDPREEVRLEQWERGTCVDLACPGGFEVLVLEGSFEEGGETFVRDSWLRLPAGDTLRAVAGPKGCRLWVKRGHLARPQRVPD